MKNVTITLPDDLAARVRVEAAKQEKSVSRFISDLLVERCGTTENHMAALERFLSGPGFPGVSRNWRGREELYAEREDELLRRYKSAGLRRRSGRAKEKGASFGLAEKDGQESYAGPQRPKSK